MIKKDKIFSILVLFSIIILGLIYFFNAELSINTNRLMEMLFNNDSKGTIMYYYEFRDISYIISLLSGALQVIVPPIAKLTVIKVNIKFFGTSLGIFMSLSGIVIGMLISYAVGRALSNVTFKIWFKSFLDNKFLNKFFIIVVFILSVLWFSPCMFVGYLSGLLLVDIKKFIPTVILGKLISLIYLVFIVI